MAGKAQFRFSFGPWNIHEGADVFGPPVRKPMEFAKKLKLYKKLGFDAVQFHDDDAVASVEVPHDQIDQGGPGDEEGCWTARASWRSSWPRACGSTP